MDVAKVAKTFGQRGWSRPHELEAASLELRDVGLPQAASATNFRSWIRENSVVSGEPPEVSLLRLPKIPPFSRKQNTSQRCLLGCWEFGLDRLFRSRMF